jgi:hypothetical protein
VCVSPLKFCLGSGFSMKARERMAAREELGCGTAFAAAGTIAWSQPWEQPATSCNGFQAFICCLVLVLQRARFSRCHFLIDLRSQL